MILLISYFTNDFGSSHLHWNITIKKKSLGTFYGQTTPLTIMHFFPNGSKLITEPRFFTNVSKSERYGRSCSIGILVKSPISITLLSNVLKHSHIRISA